MLEDSSHNFEYQDDDEVDALISRYENMLLDNKSAYFDIDEFETIIDHYILINNTDDAITATNIANSIYPHSTSLKIRSAEIMIWKNEPLKAVKLLDQLEKIEPENVQINFTKALAYIEIENTKDADVQFDLALSKVDDDDLVDLYLKITDCLIDINKFEWALKYLEQAEKKFPSDCDILYQTAYCFDHLNDAPNSIKYYQKYLDEEPFDANVWHNLGAIYSRHNQHQKAIQAFDFALTVNDEFEISLYSKANTLANIEHYPEAIQIFYDYIKLVPDNYYAHCTIGECYEKMGQYEDAINIYNQVITLDESFADAYYGLSSVMFKQNFYAEGVFYIAKALKFDPENCDYQFIYAELLYMSGKKQDALTVFKNLVEDNPHNIKGWEYVANIELELIGIQQALLTLKKACTHNYDAPQLLFHLAALYFISHDSENGLLFFEKGLNSNSKFVDSFFALYPDAKNNTTIMNLYNQNINKL